MPKKCTVPGCTHNVWGKSYCMYHQYLRADKREKKSNKKRIPIRAFVSNAINYMAAARKIFNAWIRWRDRNKGCISCEKGKVEEAGHYYSSGKYPALRFGEINTNGQCHICNCHKDGNTKAYREGLIKRYGEPEVLKLDALAQRYRGPYKWDNHELQKIIKQYRL